MIRVGVLLGGKSIEREVSFNSGRTICDHLDTQVYKVVTIFQTAVGDLYLLPISFLYRGKIADFEHRLSSEAKRITWDDLPVLVDFVYIAVHGKYAEDGRLQAMFELLKIPYLGTKVLGSALGMHKLLHNKILNSHGIATPKGFGLLVSDVINYDTAVIADRMAQNNIAFPVIVKPESEGSSLGVFSARNLEELKLCVQQSCFISGHQGQTVLIEEKIIGMEFCCILITDEKTGQFVALPPTEIVLEDGLSIFDYHHKYMPGMTNKKTPATCSDESLKKIQDVCINVAKTLGITNFCRVDGFLMTSGEVIILDSNTLSGMGPSSFLFRQAAEVGIGHGQMINHLIKAELKNYNMTQSVKKISLVKKIKIAVLFGGTSREKEISLESGRNVCYKLSPEKYEVVPLFVDSNMELHVLPNKLLVCMSTAEIQAKLLESYAIEWSSLSTFVDFVFIALHGGQGENGVVQGALEMLGLPYNGPSIFASALCMDKYKMAQFLAAEGFDVPRSLLLSKLDYEQGNTGPLHEFIAQIGLPCIVKPHDDGCSIMVESPRDNEELQRALLTIFAEKSFALVEELIVGMELTVGVVGNDNPRALAPSESVARGSILSIQEKFLPGAGENQTPARLSPEDILLVQKTVRDAFVAVTCVGYSRIDCFFQNANQSPTGKKRVVILECNTLPALTPATCLFHQAAEEGLRPMDLLDEIINLGFAAHSKNEVVSVDEILEKHP